MPTFRYIQTAFDAGEISTRLRGRVDSDAYKRGLAYDENWEVLPVGPIRKRGPTRHVASLISGGSRLIPFKTAAGEEFILELGNLELRMYTVSGRVSVAVAPGGGDGPNLLVNGGLDTDTAWTKDHATISGGRARLNVWRWFDDVDKVYVVEDGSIQQTFTVSAAGTYRVSWADGGGTANLTAMLSWVGGSAVLSSPGVVTLPATNVTISVVGSGAYGDYVYVDDIAVEAAADPASYVVNPPWTTEQLPFVQYAMETGRDRMIFVHPNVAPWFLQRNADGTWTHGNVVFATAPAGCSGSNWPGVVEIFSGRLWLAATPDEKNRVWASQVGDVFNFALGTGLDKEALDFKVATKSAIRWIRAQRNLLIGTDEGEHYITSNGAIAPSDIQVVLGSNFGSAAMQALAVGDQVLYVSPDRRKPRVIGFEYQADGWVSRDLAFLANHLTDALIDEAHFAKAPYPAAVFVMGDGTMRVCAYDRAAQVLAWWRFSTPGGHVLSAAVTDGDYGSTVWLSVQREFGVYLQAFKLDDTGPVIADGLVIRYVAGGQIDGLEHLSGSERQLVIDGSVVASSGDIAAGVLPVDAPDGTAVWAGLKFNPRSQLLPLEGGNPAGTSQGLKRRYVEIHARLNDSAIPLINGRRPEERSFGTKIDDPTARITGDVKVENVEGWDDDAVVTIEQDLPFRTEVCAIYGPVKVNA